MSRKMKKGAISLLALGIALWKPTGVSAAFTVQGNPVVSKAGVTLIGVGQVSMTAAIQTIAGVADGQINWPGLTLPATWVRSNDVLAMNATLTAANGGIQIYTDNTNAAATPKFTGNTANTDPSGLVDETNPTLRLPMAWSIKQDTGPAANVEPIATEPNNFATDNNAPQWIYLADQKTNASDGGGAVTFVNGAQGAEVMDGSLGLHAASGGGPESNGFFPGSFPTTYIFTAANFGAASTSATGHTYQTSELVLEAFTQ